MKKRLRKTSTQKTFEEILKESGKLLAGDLSKVPTNDFATFLVKVGVGILETKHLKSSEILNGMLTEFLNKSPQKK